MKRAFKVIITLALIGLLVYFVASVARSGCSTLTNISNDASPEQIVSAIGEDLFGAGDQVCSQVQISLPVHSGYTPTEDKTAYESLSTDAQRRAYASIEESLFLVTNEGGGANGRYQLKRAYIPSLSSGEIFMVKEAVLADHPEVFWVTNTYSLGFNMHDGDYIVLYTYYSYRDILVHARAMEQRVAELLRQIPNGLSEYDRELAIHDMLVRDVEYDTESVELASSFTDASTSYGTLVNGLGLCSGYSYSVKLLCNRVGISSAVIKGVSKGVGHMWNIVRIDGSWYHLDVTWNDPVNKSEESVTLYDYFNLTDDEIKYDHIIADGYERLTDEFISSGGDGNNFFNFPRAACTSHAANFYHRTALQIDDLSAASASSIAQKMQEFSVSGDSEIYLSFSENMETDMIELWLKGTLESGMSYSNSKVKSTGGRKITLCSRVVRSEASPPHWSRVYCVKLIFA